MSTVDRIIEDIAVYDKDCYGELWEHMKNLVYSIAYRYARKKRVNYDDVKQNAYVAWRSLTRTFSAKKMNGEGYEANYVNYLNKYLPKRLFDYADSYSMFDDYRVMSLSQFDNYEFLSDEFVQSDSDIKDLRVTIDEITKNFTDMRLEVFELMKEGYNKTDIGRILDVSRNTVYYHYDIIMEKINKKLK